MSDTVKLQALETFMSKVQTAARMGTKEFRLPANEAFELAAAIGQIMAENIILTQKVKDAETMIGASVRIDGGKFG